MNNLRTSTGRAEPPDTHTLTDLRSKSLTLGLLMMAMYMLGTPQKAVTFLCWIVFITSATWKLGRRTVCEDAKKGAFMAVVSP